MCKSFVAAFTLIPFPPCLSFNSNTLASYNVTQSVKILFSVFDMVKSRNKENQLGKDEELVGKKSYAKSFVMINHVLVT